jgi:hypothetical protein
VRDQLAKLRERAGELGNHHRKFLGFVESHIEDLYARLEGRGRVGAVHLWTRADDVGAEMDTVLEVADGLESQLSCLGCYYSLQFLLMNLTAIDVLKIPLAEEYSRAVTYRPFMLHVGAQFRRLTASYMGRLLLLFLEGVQAPEYVICGVGTRSDQDDIDVGIITEGEGDTAGFNRAVGRLAAEMLRRACNLHFHLSEHVGDERYSASLAEYEALLGKEICDFVIISEMLGAAPMLGSRPLFERFVETITSRYFHHPDRDNRHHEGYLRGILGEIRSLIRGPRRARAIHPKDDGLRMIKGLISAEKVIHGVREANAWQILDRLKEVDSARTAIYRELESCLDFLEIFRYLYQMLVVQEEEIRLDDPDARQGLVDVARLMGYDSLGVISASDRLLVHYYECVEGARSLVGGLVEDVRKHLASTSVFVRMIEDAKDEEARGVPGKNFAVELIRETRFFRGTRYWDDFLVALEEDGGLLLRRFTKDIDRQPKRKRAALIEMYGELLNWDFVSNMTLVSILAKYHPEVVSRQLLSDVNSAFLRNLSRLACRGEPLVRFFHFYPDAMDRWLKSLGHDRQAQLLGMLDWDLCTEEMARAYSNLKYLIQIRCGSSRYFERCFDRVFEQRPEYLRGLDDWGKLEDVSKGVLGEIEQAETPDERFEKLGLFYDLEFFRVGLMTLAGVPVIETNGAFTEFSDTYLTTLFDVSRQEVNRTWGRSVATDDQLAIYVTGGHGRERAYDDDYDLVVVLDSDDPEILEYSRNVVRKMNAELAARGILPHHRFADYVGRFVVLKRELDEILGEDREDVFVDKSQILGARLVVGSSAFGRKFERELIQPYVLNRRDSYIKQMAGEIRSRHRQAREIDGELFHLPGEIPGGLDIKEGMGGLRDIEMICLICKAKYGLSVPVNLRFLDRVGKMDIGCREWVPVLKQGSNFLRSLRDVYRLTVAADNVVLLEYLGRPAAVLGFRSEPGMSAEVKLMKTAADWMTRMGETIEHVIDGIEA